MAKNTTLKYRVAPLNGRRAHFPIDMLRYDGAYPIDQQDSARIDDTFWIRTADSQVTEPASQAKGADRSVNLICTFNGSPNDARWKSYGWEVTHVHRGVEWEPYHGQRLRI